MRYLILALATLSLYAAPCDGSRDLRIVNGQFHTLDARNTVANEITIQDGRIAAVGKFPGKLNPCTKTINLAGRTALPGLIDNHNHIVLLGIRPGYDVRLDSATSIAEVQTALRLRAERVPAGGWVTAMGGWNPAQFAEKRLPTLAELDAALPNHPALVFLSFTGPAATNTRGKAFFASKGVAVNDAGVIAANAPSLAALNALRAMQTLEDQKRGTLDALAYTVRVGLTTQADMGAFIPPGAADVADSFAMDTLATADPYRMYDAMAALHREGKLQTRVRLFYLSMDTRPDVPVLAARLRNTFRDFGDDMLRVSGIGEFASSWPLFGQPAPSNYATALKLIARSGWAYQQHSLSAAEDQLIVNTFEEVNRETPIANLRWSAAHVPRIDQALVNRLKAIGAGIAIHPFQYLAGGPNAGPPMRMIVDSGIHAGAGSDSAQISTLNPWFMIYYMVTGKNSAGALINAGQTLTRAEAIRLYTADNGWFLKEESKLGTLEPGKLADIVVLSADYFDPMKVPDENIKKIRSVLTVVDGKVVYSEIP